MCCMTLPPTESAGVLKPERERLAHEDLNQRGLRDLTK